MYSLYVGDLPPDCTEDKLLHSFTEFKSVKRANIIRNPDDKSSRRFGFIRFDDKADLDAALNREIYVDGSRLKTDVAKSRAFDMNHRSDRFRNNRYHINNNYSSHHHNHGGVLSHQNLNSHRGPSSNSHGPNPNQPSPSVSQHKSIQGPQSVQTQRPHQNRTVTTANPSSLAPTISSPVGDNTLANVSGPHSSGTPTSIANSSASSTANGVIQPMPYMDHYSLIYDPISGVPYSIGPGPIVGADMNAMGSYPPTSISGGSASSPEIACETQGIPPSQGNIYYHQGAATQQIGYGPPNSGVGPPIMPPIGQQNPNIQGPGASRFNPTRSPVTDMNGAGQPHPPQPLYYMNYWNGLPLYFDAGAQAGMYPQPFFAVRGPVPFNPTNQHPFSS